MYTRRDWLSKIPSMWTEICKIQRSQGLKAVAGFLSRHYFAALATQFKKYRPCLSYFQCEEMASDVLFDLIKNNYRYVGQLDRKKGSLRGLFFRMIRHRLAREDRNREEPRAEVPERSIEYQSQLEDHYDLHTALGHLAEESPILYETVQEFYFKSRPVSELTEEWNLSESAVRMRLLRAQHFLGDFLGT